MDLLITKLEVHREIVQRREGGEERDRLRTTAWSEVYLCVFGDGNLWTLCIYRNFCIGLGLKRIKGQPPPQDDDLLYR